MKAVAAAALLATLACAAQRPLSARKAPVQIETLPDGSKVICETERPTGSHIAEPVCRRLEDVERTRDQAQDDLRRAKPERHPQ